MKESIESVPTADLIPHPENEKYFRDTGGEMWCVFVEDIARRGIKNALILERATNRVVNGHQRLRAALELGLAEVPVTFRDYESEDELIDDLIADNVLHRDLGIFDKYRLVAVYQERIESRQGAGGGRYSKSDPVLTSARNGPKLERPRDQIAQALGLAKNDITVANMISALPEKAKARLEKWAMDSNPSKKVLEAKVRELRAAKKEMKGMKDLKQLAKRKDEIEAGMDLLIKTDGKIIPDAIASQKINTLILEGFEWLATKMAAIETLEITPESATANARVIREFLKNLDGFSSALRKKFTFQESKR